MQLTTWPRMVLGRTFHRTGHQTALVAAGLPLHLAVVPLWLWLLGTLAALVPAATALPALLTLVALPVLLTLAVTPLLTMGQRRRYRALVGKDLPRPAVPGPGRDWKSAVRRPATRAFGRQVCYHAVAGPLFALLDLAVLAVWASALVAASVYVWIWALPPQWRALEYTTQAAYLTAGGLALLFLGPRLTGALVRLETRAAEVLLGPSRAEKLARRVADLSESRAGVLDAADAERRRIERDLHDGAQQRLVSLAVNLGLARSTLGDLPEAARKVIDEAHREAKEAIAELSSLVRGLHPAVLEDRGLDAALSGVAARLPIPVRLAVVLPQRPSPTVEAVAYFVVSEALTNVVKHAQATRADVTVERIGETLLVVVADDGVGGADLAPAGGTGLAGLAKRVASVDGTFSCRSPAGGPTVITVELPCAP
ncbi:histidine kinase [Streptomyces sp. NPDC048387]|uniref:sensor histidine kinase n=1 Tax=Streptomyces sp. NPDC048387 TaxID=3365542 RepID=UPI0037154CA1